MDLALIENFFFRSYCIDKCYLVTFCIKQKTATIFLHWSTSKDYCNLLVAVSETNDHYNYSDNLILPLI